MSGRPTREQVDAALERFERQEYDAESIELVASAVHALRLDYAADIRVRNQRIAALEAALATLEAELDKPLMVELKALREENEALRAGLDEALRPREMSDEALQDWLAALKSRSNDPEIIRIQRRLLDIVDRAGKQTPEVRALVKAARELLPEEDDLDEHPLWLALRAALKPFEEP